MEIEDVKEWIQIADDDLYSAKALNDLVRKPYEIICYHCAQAIEKYLKAYLVFKDVEPKKTHNLRFLIDLCIEFDAKFQSATHLCDFVNRFSNEIRYPHRIEIKIEDVNYSLSAVERIKEIEPLKKLREIVENPEKTTDEDIEKTRHNTIFTEKLQQGILDIENGKGIVKTIAELEAMEDE